MIIITSLPEMTRWSLSQRNAGRTVGFVPTMGALHEGHLSLVARARGLTDATVLSIFVNPTQFGPAEDFNNYPRPIDNDCTKAKTAGCDAVFAPSSSEMYPVHYGTYVTVDEMGAKLCGMSRPTHFRGVATVVLKLFNIINPAIAFFGQKDAQQVIVLKRMASDLNLPVVIETCPTVREADGLAMSSRNRYLTPAERAAAPVLHKGLLAARSLYEQGEKNAARLTKTAADIYKSEPLIKKEYIEIANTITLDPLETVTTAALIAVACRTAESSTRLIDNIVIGGSL